MTGDDMSGAPARTDALDQRQERRAETVLITGASSGIGRELARLYARDGAAVSWRNSPRSTGPSTAVKKGAS
jgi:NADPH:quinone reductase-like Zn-dependent oxidoreductase